MSIIIEEFGRRIRSEATVNLLRIITVVLFIVAMVTILINFDPGIWNPVLLGAGTTNVQFPLPTLFYYLILLLGQIFTNAFITVYWGVYVVFWAFNNLGSIFGSLMGVPASPFTMALPPAFVTIGVSPDELFVAFYFSLFPLFVIGSILSFMYFILNCDAKWSFWAFICMIFPVFLSVFTPLIGIFIRYLSYATFILPILTVIFGLIAVIFVWKLKTAISKRKLKWIRHIMIIIIALVFFNSFLTGGNLAAIGADLESFTQLVTPLVNNITLFFANINFFTFILNPVFLTVLVSLLFLEVSFQTSYVYEVFLPSALRGKRLEEQMEELERLATLKEEEKKVLESEEEVEPESRSFTVRKYFSSEAFDYMREMIEKRKKADKKAEARKKMAKKKLKKYTELEEEEILDMARVQQLFTYLEERYRQDPMAKETLTASAATPSRKKILISAGKSTLYRVVTLILLTFLIMNVANFFYAFSPPDIVFSLEILTAEMIIIFLLPIALVFPLIGSIIKLQRRPKIYRRPKAPEKKPKNAKKPKKRAKRMKPPAETPE